MITLSKSMPFQEMLMSSTSKHVVLVLQITMYWSNKLNLPMQRSIFQTLFKHFIYFSIFFFLQIHKKNAIFWFKELLK